jgi:hypothetical protein
MLRRAFSQPEYRDKRDSFNTKVRIVGRQHRNGALHRAPFILAFLAKA